MSGTEDGYAYAITRVTELEVDLANAMSGLRRSQEDNESLLANQADLMGSYKRLQDQNDRLRMQLAREQEDRNQFHDEHQRQIIMWREQLESKARDLEEIQAQMPAPRELDVIQMELAEEIHDKYRRKIEDLETQCAAEAQRATDACRQMELQRLDNSHREQETRDQLAEELQRHDLKEQGLKRRVATLEGELRKQTQKIEQASQSDMQTHDLETRVLGLQRELQEQERHSEKERKQLGEKILARDQELNTIRRRLHEVQIDLETQERAYEKTASDLENLRREHTKVNAQLAESKHKIATMKPAEESDALLDELAQVKSSLANEREQLTHRLKLAEDRASHLQAAARQAEAKTKLLEEERDDREQELQHEHEEAERMHSAEISSLHTEVERNKHELEKRNLAWREKEASLTCKWQEQKAKVESLTDDMAQCQLAQRECEKALEDARRDFKQRESLAARQSQMQMTSLQTELASVRDREANLARDCAQNEGELEKTRAALRKHQQRTDALQAEVQVLNQRLDKERGQWIREADEAQLAAVRVEEERRNSLVHELTEDFKQKMSRFQTASKRALQKAARKRQALRQKCQELARRVSQVSQERATAIKVCEENKAAFEIRLAELGMASRLSAGVGPPVLIGGVTPSALRKDVVGKVSVDPGCMNKWELQAMRDRLAQNAEILKGSSAGLRVRDAKILSQAIGSPPHGHPHSHSAPYRGEVLGEGEIQEAGDVH